MKYVLPLMALSLAGFCAGLPDLSGFRDLSKSDGGKIIQERFETRDDETWNFSKAPGFYIAKRMGLNGTNALGYNRTVSGDYPILSHYYDLDVNCTYIYRFFVRTEGMTRYDKKTEIRYVGQIEYLDKNGNWIAGASSDTNGMIALNQDWKEIVIETKPPRETHRARVIFFLEADYMGKIFWDNLTIEEKSKVAGEIYDRRPANLRLDEQGTIELQSAIFGTEPVNSADLAILVDAGGKKQLLENKGGRYTGKFGAFPAGKVEVKASLLNMKEKTIITSKSFNLFAGDFDKTAGSAKIDDKGYVRIDGKKFMPVGFFGDNLTDKDMDRLQEAEVNFYMPYTSMLMGDNGAYTESFDAVERAVNRLGDRGIKVLFGLNGQNPSQGSYARQTYDGVTGGAMEVSKAFAKRLGKNPNLLGYYISDENPVGELPYVRSVREMLAETDPNHFSVTLTFVPDDFPLFVSTGDVLAVDSYPISDHKYQSIQPIYSLMEAAVKLDYPVWFCPQAFSWGAFKHFTYDRVDDFKKYPFPSEKELRAMSLAGAIAGAKGFLFYAYNQVIAEPDKFIPGSGEKNWANVVPSVKLLRELEPFIMSEEKAPEFTMRNASAKKHTAAMWKCGDQVRLAVTGNGPGNAKTYITIPGYPDLKSKYGLTENLGGGKYLFKCQGVDSDILY